MRQKDGLGDRLSNKLKLVCHKNQIQNVIVDWLVHGTVEEKNDVNNILSNCDEALELVNGLNHKLNPKYEKRDFYADLNRMLFKLLTKNPEYENKRTKNRHNIEVRGWLLTVYAETLSEKNHKDGLKVLKGFINNECDVNVTVYWALIAILYNLNYYDKEEKRKYINSIFDSLPAPFNDEKNKRRNQSNNGYDRLYWLIVIWFINNTDGLDESKSDKYKKQVDELLRTHDIDRTAELNNEITELFVALSCKTCVKIVKSIQIFVDGIIEKDLEGCWDEKDIHMYKYLIICLRNYGRKKHKNDIGDVQSNLYYKIVKLLSITRNYSSRIWNEVRLQILKTIRLYHRTTKKRIIDELKEELLEPDMSIVFEACKTLKCVFKIETCLENIITVLYNESVKNISFDDDKIYAISYSLKILSLKEATLINDLQDLEQTYDDYNKKNIVRKLFTEMGGMQAIRKSQQNADIRKKYMAMTSEAQKKVEEMFHRSIQDAKNAFKISLYMNIIVFLVGITLLGISGIMAIMSNEEDNWAGVGISSGTGFLSVVYSLFINKPSRKIRKNTNHLMRLKVIFLGYLRELTQMDQSFSKNLMDNDNISQYTLEGYVTKIKGSMTNSLNALRWEEVIHLPDENEMRKKIMEDIKRSEKKPQRTIGMNVEFTEYIDEDGNINSFKKAESGVGTDDSKNDDNAPKSTSESTSNSIKNFFTGGIGLDKIYKGFSKIWKSRNSKDNKITEIITNEDGESKEFTDFTDDDFKKIIDILNPNEQPDYSFGPSKPSDPDGDREVLDKFFGRRGLLSGLQVHFTKGNKEYTVPGIENGAPEEPIPASEQQKPNPDSDDNTSLKPEKLTYPGSFSPLPPVQQPKPKPKRVNTVRKAKVFVRESPVLHAAYSKHESTPRDNVGNLNTLGNDTAKNGKKLTPPNMVMTIEKEDGSKESEM